MVLQQEARNKGVGLVVLFEGWNGAGKGSRISDLMYHLDARATSVHVTENLDVEAARSFAGTDQGVTGFFPVMQEFWKALGPRGDITFYDRGWYTAAMQQVLFRFRRACRETTCSPRWASGGFRPRRRMWTPSPISNASFPTTATWW